MPLKFPVNFYFVEFVLIVQKVCCGLISQNSHDVNAPVNRTPKIDHHWVMGGKKYIEMFGSFTEPFIYFWYSLLAFVSRSVSLFRSSFCSPSASSVVGVMQVFIAVCRSGHVHILCTGVSVKSIKLHTMQYSSHNASPSCLEHST